jgi:hypothetical protein
LKKDVKGHRNVRRSISTKYNGLSITVNVWFDENILKLCPTCGYYGKGIAEDVRSGLFQAMEKFNVQKVVSGFSVETR